MNSSCGRISAHVKTRIAQATLARTADFKLETMWGEQVPYDAVAKEAFERLLLGKPELKTAAVLQNKPLVELRIVATSLREMPGQECWFIV